MILDLVDVEPDQFRTAIWNATRAFRCKKRKKYVDELASPLKFYFCEMNNMFLF